MTQSSPLATRVGCRLSLTAKTIIPTDSRVRSDVAAFTFGVGVATAIITAIAITVFATT